MSGKINLHICLMLIVYKSYQTVKYGWHRNHILQDLTGLEIWISMKASKTKSWFETGFQQLKSGLQKKDINLPSWLSGLILPDDRNKYLFFIP